GTYKTHVPAQHVNELRQFVQAVASDEPSDGRYSRVFSNLEDVSILLIRCSQVRAGTVYIHGSKLQKHKVSSTFTDAPGLIQDWSLRSEFDKSRNYRQCWRQHHDRRR